LRSREPNTCADAIRDHIFVKLDDIREWQEAKTENNVPVMEAVG
jgi:hypothetical protein